MQSLPGGDAEEAADAAIELIDGEMGDGGQVLQDEVFVQMCPGITDRVRRVLIGPERERVLKIIRTGLETRPKL